MTNIKRNVEKAIASKIEKSCSSPMWFKHSMSIAQHIYIAVSDTHTSTNDTVLVMQLVTHTVTSDKYRNQCHC